MTVSIVALTLNEIDGVKVILPAIRPEWYDQLIVVDGGSRDGTIEWCREHGYEVFERTASLPRMTPSLNIRARRPPRWIRPLITPSCVRSSKCLHGTPSFAVYCSASVQEEFLPIALG